jgi:DNA-binding HxlR family transcriptional regulator
MKKVSRTFNCPTEFALSVLGGKWKTIILAYLRERPCRYAELRKIVPKLSEKMLTERLRELEHAGLIAGRSSRGSADGQVYVLSQRGKSLGPVLAQLYTWGLANAALFKVEVGEPLAHLRSETGWTAECPPEASTD